MLVARAKELENGGNNYKMNNYWGYDIANNRTIINSNVLYTLKLL